MKRPAVLHAVVGATFLALFGDQLVGFALGAWFYERTGLVTINSAMVAATTLPFVLFAPVAGVLVDRFGPRPVLGVGALGAAASALAMTLLLGADRLDPWTAGLVVAAGTALRSGEFAAVSTVTTLLVTGEERGRANGLVQLAFALPHLAAPAVSGYLLSAFGVARVLEVDVVSALLAAAVFYATTLPRPPSRSERATMVAEAKVALAFVGERSGLAALLLFFAAVNFDLGVTQVIVTPLVLGFASARELGLVMSAGGSGAAIGSLLMTVWGGPRSRVGAILAATAAQGAALVLGGLRPSVPLVALAAFAVMFTFPIVAVSSQVIWQRKVPVELQGRMAALREAIGGGAVPIANAVAGPLADRLFEPAMRPGGALAVALGRWVGVPPGRGVAVMMGALGLTSIVVAGVGACSRRLRAVETELPDRS